MHDGSEIKEVPKFIIAPHGSGEFIRRPLTGKSPRYWVVDDPHAPTMHRFDWLLTWRTRLIYAFAGLSFAVMIACTAIVFNNNLANYLRIRYQVVLSCEGDLGPRILSYNEQGKRVSLYQCGAS